MFVSIDMDRLVFLHKHHDHDTLSALAFLEAPDHSIRVENTEAANFLKALSRLDLCVLYKNTTGATLVAPESHVLRQQLLDMVMTTAPTVAFHDEVSAQVAAVEDDLHKGIAYSYARGAKKPAKAGELFPLVAKPLTDAQLLGAERRAPQPLTHAPEAPKAPPPPPKPARQPSGSVRPVIWQHADAGWEAAGKPTDKAAVLALRKQWMAELLEQKEIKPTTSSNELGAWQKSRLG